MRLRKLREGLCCLLVGQLSVAGMSLMPAFERGDTVTQSQFAKSGGSRSGEVSAVNTALTQVALRDRVQLDDELLHEAGGYRACPRGDRPTSRWGRCQVYFNHDWLS